MNELREEIYATMQALNQENAQPVVEEFQSHLANLLEMVRDELQQRLKERSWSDPSIGITEQSEAPYKSVRIDCGDKQPLTAEELKAGGWWCGDTSEDCRLVFVSSGINVWSESWVSKTEFKFCYLAGTIVLRASLVVVGLKQIHRIGNQFFWSDAK